MTLLEVDAIAVRYDAALAVHDVSLELAEGEVVALVGPNGAGKTTTLRAICGSVPLAGGAVRLRGAPLAGGPRAALRGGIAHCPEGRHVFPQMTVRENVELGGYTLTDRVQRRRCRDELMGRFPVLAERSGQRAGTLSGGEQQMLAMARALMTAPEILLLDEPTMGLAPVVAIEIARLVEELRASGTAIVLVEESAELALRLADRVSVIEAGRVAICGTPDELAETDLMRHLYLGAGAA